MADIDGKRSKERCTTLEPLGYRNRPPLVFNDLSLHEDGDAHVQAQMKRGLAWDHLSRNPVLAKPGSPRAQSHG